MADQIGAIIPSLLQSQVWKSRSNGPRAAFLKIGNVLTSRFGNAGAKGTCAKINSIRQSCEGIAPELVVFAAKVLGKNICLI